MRALALLACLAALPAAALEAPNVVPITAKLVTSGQPPAKSLAGLGAEGFEAVIYLAPPTVGDAVKDEPEIVRKQGLEFVNIPIPFGTPSRAHLDEFFAVMKRLEGRKVLVHCQVNLRASTLTFLWRVVAKGEKSDLAWESVSRVWTPEGPWKALVVERLREAKVDFDPW